MRVVIFCMICNANLEAISLLELHFLIDDHFDSNSSNRCVSINHPIINSGLAYLARPKGRISLPNEWIL